jgi:outer membrane protein OmpA-like peptidoglycan-associated protein
MKTTLLATTVLMGALLMTGCTTNPATGNYEINRTGVGLALGTAAGAAVGAALGDGSYAIKGAMMGAAIGGGAGYVLEQQHRKLQQDLSQTQMKVEMGVDAKGTQVVTVSTPSDVTFEPGSPDITAQSYAALSSLAKSLKDKKLQVEITGHTDNVGAKDFNQQLSYDRARAVGEFLYQGGVPAENIKVRGASFAEPIADNNSKEGRAKNRRVVIAIHAV